MINNTLNQPSKKPTWGIQKPQYTSPSFGTKTTTPQYGVKPAPKNNFTTGGLLSPQQDLSKGYTPTNTTPLKGLLSPVQTLSNYGTGGGPQYKTPTGQTHTPAAPSNSSPQQSLQQKAQEIQNSLNGGVTNTPMQNEKKVSTVKEKAPKAPEPDPLKYSSIVKNLLDASNTNKTQKGLIERLKRNAQDATDIGNRAQGISDKYAAEINRVGQLGAGAVAGNLSTGSNVVGSGNAAIASQSVSSRMSALSNAQQAELEGVAKQLQAQGYSNEAINAALGGANTQQATQLGGLGNAAGFAQPVQVPYNNQYVDPITGQPIGGGSVNGSLQQAAQSIAQQVQNGTMSYDQGVQALSGYGQGGMNMLQQMLGSGFSPLQSNAQAAANQAATLQTGTIGGELTKQADTVVQHMQTLKAAYKQLTAQYGIPAINQGINWFKGKIGDGELQSYKIALTNVRDELAKILGGGTSTDGTRATAESLLPDNMSPSQIDAAITTATELMHSKIQEYTRAPQYGNQQQQQQGGGVVQTSAGAINTNW